MEKPARLKLNLRKPAWAERCRIQINSVTFEPGVISSNSQGKAACGLDFDSASWLHIDKKFSSDDEIVLVFDIPIRLLNQDAQVTKCGGKVAVARGPLLYCLEGIQNPANLDQQILAPGTLMIVEGGGIFKGLPVIQGKSTNGETLTFTPYFLWGNRGDTAMTVLIDERV